MKRDEYQISTFCKTSSGGTPSRSKPEYYNGTIPWVKSGELREAVVLSASEHITEHAIKESSAKIVPAGALLVAMYGATIGRVAYLGISAATNQAVCNIIPDESKADRQYLFYALRSKATEWISRGAGGAQPNISQKIIRETKIPLPPLEEQKRIAAILDKADAIRKKRTQAIELTEQFLRSAFLDMFGDPITNPKGWELRTIKETKSLVQIGPFGSLLHKEDYISGGVPLINPKHIINNIIVVGCNETITRLKAEELKKYCLQEDDVIMGRRGEMGRCVVVTVKTSGMLCGTGSLFIRPNPNILASVYLSKVLSSDSMKAQLEREAWGVTMANLNRSKVEFLRIPIPPLELQSEFTSIVEKTRKVMGRFEVVEQADDNLFNALSQQVF